MGGIRALHDVIVVGMGPGGATTASMLRAPSKFSEVVGTQALDVLALEARAAMPMRDRVVNVTGYDANFAIQDAWRLLGVPPTEWHHGNTTIAGVEQLMRSAAHHVGVDAAYGRSVVKVEDLGHAGVRATLADGTVVRARFLVDASGGRIGAFDPGPVTDTSVYLSGQLPASASGDWIHGAYDVRVHGAGQDRATSMLFGFEDSRSGITAYVEYPSLPRNGMDSRVAERLLRTHLDDGRVPARGLRDVGFVVTEHRSTPKAAHGSMFAIGDTVSRISPETTWGVSKAIANGKQAANAIHEIVDGRRSQAQVVAEYANLLTPGA